MSQEGLGTVTVDRLRFYLLLGWLLPIIVLAGEQTESLEYGVIYRGLFSMGTDMGIADVMLESHRPDGGQLGETQLEATSAAYPLVESLYPLRYRFRTWTAPAADRRPDPLIARLVVSPVPRSLPIQVDSEVHGGVRVSDVLYLEAKRFACVQV